MSAATAYDRLLDALHEHGSRVRANGVSATAQCPAHDDRNPSLSVRPIEGSVLLHCHAGCRVDDILAGLKLGARDLYDEPAGARYNYTDPAGKVLRTVHRSPQKAFRQSGDTTGTPPLYRLPAVAQARQDGTTVYVVEGEKDVHALESVGAVATCSPMGASNAGRADWTPLTGAHVVLMPDRDQAGQRYASDVLAALDGKAASVRVALPKVGKDAADHVAAGYGLEELEPVEVETPTPTGPVTVTLSSVMPELVTWVWPGRLPGGKISVLDGDPSVGKSTMAVDWAARVSTGTPWPDGSPCVAGDVLVMSAEDGLADTIRPRLDAAGGDADRVHSLRAIHFRDDDGNLRERAITLADTDVIEQAVRRHHARLVIVDVLMAYLPTGTDSHKDQDIRTVLARVAAVAEDTGCCVLLLRHMNKTSGGNVLYRGGGSIGIVGAARAAYVAAPDPDDDTGTKRVLACTKNNLAPMPASLAYQLTPASNGTASVSWQGETATSAATLLSVLSSSDERTERDEAVEWLLAYLEHHGGTVKRAEAIRDAKRDGIAQRTLERARDRAGIRSERAGFGQGADWTTEATVLPFAPQSRHSRQAPEAGATGANGGATVAGPTPEADPTGDTQPDVGTCSRCQQPRARLDGFDRRGRPACTDCSETTAPTKMKGHT